MAAPVVRYTTTVLIPLLLMLRIFLGHAGSRSMFWAEASVSALYFILIFRTGSWGVVGYALRYLLPILFVAAVAFGYLGAGVTLPAWTLELSTDRTVLLAAATAVLAVLNKRASAAKVYPGVPIRLTFPLRHGTYCILEGGDSKKSRLMNRHNGGVFHTKSCMNRSMRFAVDIVKLKYGIHRGIPLPKGTKGYNIDGETLYCPCDGVVSEIVDGYENEIPFTDRHPYSVGNRIVIQRDGVNVLMGHLRKGSISVRVGDKVLEGQAIAAVGDSGLTSFPNLHIQAMREDEASIWYGEGVPILFDYEFLVKNKLKRQKVRKVTCQ